MPGMPARPMEELTTQIVPLPGGEPSSSRSRRQRGPLAFMRTLRWRLTLTYAALFAVLLVVLGLVLNGIIGRVLYAEDLQSFRTDMVDSVSTNHGHFDLAVTGTQPGCVGAISYQQAFQDTVATPLSSRTGVSAVYLLDRLGNVLAPETGGVTVGDPGPYLQAATFTAVRRNALQPGATATSGVLGSGAYQMTNSLGQRVGVVLVAVRYHTASPCVNQRNAAVGIVEVVTDFARVQRIMDTVHLVLALSILAAVVVGALVAGPLTAQALRPLTRMTRTAQRIASGDLSQRVRLPHGGDEIGRLADTFDEMIARIEAAFSAQQASEERMRQFIADASHELRTPLTSIRGYTDVLLRGAKDDPETAQQVLLATRREAERMSRLVGDLLTLARLDTGRPLELQPVDVIALTGEAVDQARIMAGEREVSLRTDGRGRLLVLADRDRLKQVLLVLLDNALKYGRQTPEGWVRVRVWREDGIALVSVADNGPGIAPQDLPHIFDRFYRAERGTPRRTPDIDPAAAAQPRPTGAGTGDTPRPSEQRDGTGLGLAIARAIVRAHGGMLNVRSEPGVGASFTVSLPLAPGPGMGAGPWETRI
jgi:two-component system OmpR family sensor kinase